MISIGPKNEDTNYFSLLKIDYNINGTQAEIEKVTFSPVEFFDWNCLTIGALGWGQIQIADANFVNTRTLPNEMAEQDILVEIKIINSL